MDDRRERKIYGIPPSPPLDKGGALGEVIDIIKKNGAPKAAADAALRKDLIEELTDVLMYYNDVLLCYDVTEEELKQVYVEKFQRNMTRW